MTRPAKRGKYRKGHGSATAEVVRRLLNWETVDAICTDANTYRSFVTNTATKHGLRRYYITEAERAAITAFRQAGAVGCGGECRMHNAEMTDANRTEMNR